MASSLKRGLRSGLIFGIIFIFMTMIGFINVAASIIGDLTGTSGQVGPGGMLPVGHLLAVLILFGLFAGFSSRSKGEDEKWWAASVSGLAAGLVSGLLAAGIVWLLGTLQYKEVELNIERGFKIHNDVPVISVIYPIFKFIFG